MRAQDDGIFVPICLLKQIANHMLDVMNAVQVPMNGSTNHVRMQLENGRVIMKKDSPRQGFV